MSDSEASDMSENRSAQGSEVRTVVILNDTENYHNII